MIINVIFIILESSLLSIGEYVSIGEYDFTNHSEN